MNINAVNSQNFGMGLHIPIKEKRALQENSRAAGLDIDSYERFQDALIANQNTEIYDVYYKENNEAVIDAKEPIHKNVKTYKNVRTIDDLSKVLEDTAKLEREYQQTRYLSGVYH